MNHELLVHAADDLEAGGITAEVMAGCAGDRSGTVPGLRFAGAVHRLVLEGRAPRLARHYPTAGGTPDLDALWSDAEPVLREHTAELRQRITATVVQTNEPGRGAVLFGGLLVAAQHAAAAAGRRTPFPVRLFEVGASAGLNLRPHRVGYRIGDGTILGDPASPLRLDPEWSGLPLADLSVGLRVAERAGCDVDPVDVGTRDGRLHLSSFVWPDQTRRWRRLQDAFDLAASDPVRVQRAAGAAWLRERLSRPVPGVLTVVWHSVVWQYVPPDERAQGRAALAEAARRSSARAPLALLVYEPRRTRTAVGPKYRFDLLLRMWPAEISRCLGSGSGHGIPFRWEERPYR